MKKKILEIIKANAPLIIAVIIIIVAISIIISIESERDGFPLGIGNRGGGGSILSVTTSTLTQSSLTDWPIVTGPVILHSIGIGKAGEQVALFDSVSGTDNTSIMFFVTASAAQMWQVDLQFDDGIMVNTTDQSQVMLFYTPLE